MTRRLVCVGSYTPEAGGNGRGITTFWQDARTGELTYNGTVATPAPSWLLWHPELPVLYAANELTDGAVTAFGARSDGTLHAIGTLPSGGGAPCHLALSPDGRHLLVANYGGGSIAVFSLDDTGRLLARTDLVQHAGQGVDPARQEGPHVHMVVPVKGSDLVHAVDLGTDEIRTYRLDVDGRLSLQGICGLPAGTGPRQLVRHTGAARAYVAGELASTLVVLDEAPGGTFTVRQVLPATSTPHELANFPSELALSDDNALLYLANRGADVITAFATDDPAPVAEYPVGAFPRHFALVGEYLYVAAQHADEVAALALGEGGRHAWRYSVGSPTCVAAAPLAVGTQR